MLTTLVGLLFAGSLFAQGAEKIKEATLVKAEKVNEKLQEGWTPRLKLSSNISISSNSNVIGQTNGESETFGGKLDSGLVFRAGNNEWRQGLLFDVATTRTPAVPRYVKSIDSLKYNTMYLRNLESMDWLGPYVSASAETSAFFGEDVRSEKKTYVDDVDGTVYATNTETFRLTDGFNPLVTREALGFFAKAIEKKNTLLEFRLGLGAIQVQADDQFSVSGVADNGDIKVKRLESFEQVGLDYGLVFKGKWDKKSDYAISADFLTPFGQDVNPGKPCEDCSDLELTNVDVKAKVSTKIYDWATLAYEYKAIRQPQLQERWQIQHGFVLNFVYDVF